jgi:tripartite-type tricarboxylate transporter receptor subunit TctC
MARWILVAAFALLAAAVLPARAAWPERPISLIVGFAPGGGTDIAARTVARFLEPRLGQPVVVVNRPGAAGELGYTATARAAPDGYTFGMTNTPNLVTLPIERRTHYRFSDLAMVANLVDDPGGLWVRADSPFRTVRDVVKYARANPERLSWGITGRGSYLDFSRRDLERLTGTRITAVAYPGSAAIFQGLLNGSLMVGAPSMAEGAALARQGQIRALGQMGAQRWAGAPEVPTFREQGFDIIGGSMRGIAAPAGTPPEIIRRMAAMLREVAEDPEFRRQAEAQALPLRYLGPEEITAVLLAMRETYLKVWRERPWVD